MDPIEYQKMAAVEDDMWYYHALHRNIMWAVGRFVQGRSKLLDAGCGTGGLLNFAAGLRPADQIYGVDFASLAIDFARSKLPSGDFSVASVTDMPFADNFFDIAISADVICQVKDPGLALAEIRRCLRPDGVLVVNMPAFQWLYSYHDRAVHNLRRYNNLELRHLLESAGFDVRLITYWNSFLFPIIVVQRRLFGSRNESSDVHCFPKPLEALFRMITSAERLLLRCGVRFPWGCAIMAVAVKRK